MKKKRDYALSNQWNPWRKMLIFKNILVIFVLSLAINAQGQQRTKVTLDLKNITLNEINTELKKQTDYDFFYNSELAKSKGQISVKAENKEVKQLLDEILPKLGLEYAIQQNLISIREKKTIELIKIEGKVTDEKGIPIPGATAEPTTMPSPRYPIPSPILVLGIYREASEIWHVPDKAKPIPLIIRNPTKRGI